MDAHDVQLDVDDRHVLVTTPIRVQIVHQGLITRVLNNALMVFFNLNSCAANEGGVEGIVDKELVELRNCPDQIGLEDYQLLDEYPGCQRVLRAYEALLQQLFLEDVSLGGGVRYKPGAILEVSDPEEAEMILWIVVAGQASSEVANRVFRWLKIELPDFSG